MIKHAVIVAALVLVPLRFMTAVLARQEGGPQSVILITLDGVRTHEMFGGLDLEVLQSTMKEGPGGSGDVVLWRVAGPRPPKNGAESSCRFSGS